MVNYGFVCNDYMYDLWFITIADFCVVDLIGWTSPISKQYYF